VVIPDYAGGGIANLMASLVMGRGGRSEGLCVPAAALAPEQAAAYRNVALVVIDGLGYRYLTRHPEAAWLNAHLSADLTSVFPSTTATAVTTFLTGLAPRAHAITGWHMYFRELGSVIAVLPGRARYGGADLGQSGVSAHRLFDHQAVFDRMPVASVVVSPAHIAQSDFNLSHLGAASLRPYRGLNAMVDILADTARTGRERQYIYAYWPDLDSIGHAEGMESEGARAHLLAIDRALADLAEKLRGTDTLLVVTADHGQVDTTERDRIDLDDHPELAESLILPLCGESRLAYCYVRPHRTDRFERYVLDHLSDVAELAPSAELVAQGWFGPGPSHPRLLERIGDYVLMMKGRYVVKDWLPQERRHVLIGVHGGVSEDEMRVPLVLCGG